MGRFSFTALIITAAALLCNLAAGEMYAQTEVLRPKVSATSGAPGDSLAVSLITCEPGPQIYELYGHTAIRIRHMRTGDDVAFNYGMFNFDAPNFVMRFVLGETDYMLGVYPYEDFLEEYRLRGSKVIEQTLNLTAQEKERLLRALAEMPGRKTARIVIISFITTVHRRRAI